MSAEGLSLGAVGSFVGALFKATSWAAGGFWVQLHTNHPGAAGTANVATEVTRMDGSAAFGADLVDNGDGTATITSDGDVGPWTAVPATETFTHYTVWDDDTAGAFLFSGEVTDGSVTAGDDWTAHAGMFAVTFAIAN